MMKPTEAVEAPTALHPSRVELEAGLDYIRQSPKNHGTLESIVIRPQRDERLVLETVELSPQFGVHGDNWATRGGLSLPDGSPHPAGQVTVMNARAIALLARTKDRWALAGDQLYVDLDLSEDNLQPGQQLNVGTVILEVTDKPHRGCAKFSARYGPEALKFVNSEAGWHLHLRGIYVKVVQAGKVRVGDDVIIKR
jgi:MOSC domain-containing protein YiiM